MKTWAKVGDIVYFRAHFSNGMLALSGWQSVAVINEEMVLLRTGIAFRYPSHSICDIILPESPLTRLLFPERR